MDLHQPAKVYNIINIEKEKCTAGFTASSCIFQAINNGFTAAFWISEKHKYFIAKVCEWLHGYRLEIAKHQ